VTLIATVAALVASGSLLVGGGAAPLKVAVTAPGHTPKVNTHWNYAVRITRGGKPVAGKLSEQIVDPIGGKHPVEFGTSTKPITNWPFKGVFRDFIVWPASSRGIPLRFRVIVVVGKTRRVVDYAVTPRA
jgi:hypothetical protein